MRPSTAIAWTGALLIVLAVAAAPRGCTYCNERHVLPAQDESASAAPSRIPGAAQAPGPRPVEVDPSRSVVPAEAAEREPPAEPAPAEGQRATGTLGGRLLLMDGSPLPLVKLVARPQLPPGADRTGFPARRTRTDLNGSFELERLPRVPHTLSLRAGVDLREADVLQTPPRPDCRLRVDGYALLVRAADADGRPLPGAWVQATEPYEVGRNPIRQDLVDEDGYKVFLFAEPVRGVLSGRYRELSGEAEFELGAGAERSLRIVLTLAPPSEVGRVEVRVLDRSGARLGNYAVRVENGPFGSLIRVLDSSDAGSDGTFAGLPAGRHVAELVPKHLGRPSCYLTDVDEVGFQVNPGELTAIEFVVTEGGRLRLHVEDASETPFPTVFVTLTDERGRESSVAAVIPQPDGGVKGTRLVPVGTPLLTRRVWPAGRYTLTAKALDGRTAEAEVVVRTGQVVEARLRL